MSKDWIDDIARKRADRRTERAAELANENHATAQAPQLFRMLVSEIEKDVSAFYEKTGVQVLTERSQESLTVKATGYPWFQLRIWFSGGPMIFLEERTKRSSSAVEEFEESPILLIANGIDSIAYRIDGQDFLTSSDASSKLLRDNLRRLATG